MVLPRSWCALANRVGVRIAKIMPRVEIKDVAAENLAFVAGPLAPRCLDIAHHIAWRSPRELPRPHLGQDQLCECEFDPRRR